MSKKLTRRRAAAGLAAVVAIPKHGRAADETTLVAGAKSDGTLTWYIAQVDAQSAENLGRSFTQHYPGVNVGVIRTTGQVAYQRLLLDIKNHVPQCDVFSTTDIAHMPILKERHELAEYKVANADALLPAFKALSDPGYSYITNAARYFLIYNKDKVKPEDVPRAWTDMLDPKWKGRVATGHPAFSGCTGTWALGVKKVHGWEFFEKLAKNNPRIGRSAVDPMTLINAGECLVGVGAANNAYASIDKGNPIGVVHPSDGLVLCVTPSAIPAKAPHPQAARLFMEWLLSPDYARLIAADGSEPILTGVPPRSGMPPLADQKIISLTVDEIRVGVPQVIEQWRDTFGS
ncbi:MAG TPA: extracellular solute-binding protein [Acetobacteraceae bacterium]|jgi:iron(III) transport system substrate-binding protein|nr:extracellular solute-binding protein [Acetobacteraceae bacterium]HEX4368600.1 extracellular solute-binding protein [Rhodopila sp.]